MAAVLERAGIAEDLFQAVYLWAGGLRGGLAISTVISCAVMAAMVGVVGAEVVTFGLLALPAMSKRKYDKQLALGTICAGGGLAVLIPPSVIFIIYAMIANCSVGDLFLGGIIPGVLLAAIFILYIVFRTLINPPVSPCPRPGKRGISPFARS